MPSRIFAKRMAPKFKLDKAGFPDPLHIEFPKNHKRLFEVVYAAAILGAIITIISANAFGLMPIEQQNISSIVVLILVVLLGAYIFEKSSFHQHDKRFQRPLKSSS